MADDVLTDVGGRGQAVQAVEQLYTGDVMFTGLFVQLVPEHTSHPLQGKGSGDHASTATAELFPSCEPALEPGFYSHLLHETHQHC